MTRAVRFNVKAIQMSTPAKTNCTVSSIEFDYLVAVFRPLSEEGEVAGIAVRARQQPRSREWKHNPHNSPTISISGQCLATFRESLPEATSLHQYPRQSS